MRRGMRMKRSIKSTAILLLSAGCLLSGCGSAEPVEVKAETALEVNTINSERGDIEYYSEYMASVETGDETVVMPLTSGQVLETYFEEGDNVKAGDLLFTIDSESAEIAVTQAQASLTSAQASLSSAEASEQAAQYNLLYTQAEITENLGTVDTSQMELENKVASAKYALKEAEENRELSKQSLSDAQDNYEDIEDEIDDLKDDIHQYKKYKESLEKIRSNYNNILNSSDPKGTVSQYIDYGKLSGVSDSSSAEEFADAYIKAAADADSKSELDTMISAADSTVSSSQSAKSGAEDNKDTRLTSQITAAINLEIQKNKVLAAEDSKKLAEKMLADYENYTKATIMARENASLASTNSSLIGAQANVQSAKANVTSAQAGVQSAQKTLDNTKVTAPVSGVIKEKSVNRYEMAQTGSSACVITSADSVKLVFYVPEKTFARLETGQEIEIEKNEKIYTGYITKLYDITEDSSGLYKVEAEASGEDALLKPGMNVKVRLVSEKEENTMLIPLNVVYYENGNAYVYLAENGKAVKTQIETGISSEDSVEVKSGISQESQIIASWSSQMKDGITVSVSNDSPAEETNEPDVTGEPDVTSEPDVTGKLEETSVQEETHE